MTVERDLSSLPLNSRETQTVSQEAIPRELLPYQHWVCWRYVERGAGKKPEKQPVNPRTLHKAGVHWPNTWTDFGTAYNVYSAHYTQGIQGIGFVLTPDDPYVAVDLDGCIQGEAIDQQAAAVIEQLGSYTEVSPSGQGIRILVSCAEFRENIRRAQFELYSHARYVTITGHHMAGTPAEIVTVTLNHIAALIPPSLPGPDSSTLPLSEPKHYAVSDLKLWERIFAHDKYGGQHLRRFQGDTSQDRGDHSFTVIRLLNCLARWTHSDPGRMRAMILLSPLANDKWFEQRGGVDWLDHQIADAIAYVTGRKRK